MSYGIAYDQQLQKMVYESQSPDESALLNASKENNFVLTGRTKESITIEVFGQVETYPLLNVLEFTSTRKR